MSLPSSSDHFEEIEKLKFKEQYFLAIVSLPPIFVDNSSTTELARYFKNMGKKIKAKQSISDITSSGGENGSKEEE